MITADVYLFKVKNGMPEQGVKSVNSKDNRMISLTGVFILIDFSGVFIVKFEKILHIVLIFLLLTLNN